ncbi:MAG: patatin-like phospholipase family protein [Streptomycetales bacterium]
MSTRRSSGPRRRGPRRGLVLGGGGVLGAAWTIGALCAVEEIEGWDPRTAEFLVGTSAGAVLAALLGTGATPRQLRDHQRGVRIGYGPLAGHKFDYKDGSGGALPTLPRPGIGSSRLLFRTALRPWRHPPTAVVSAFVPPGRGSLEGIRALVETVATDGEWSPHPGVRVVAMDYETGRRVPFGHPGSPQARLSNAVMASCAIPGWYAPVEIDGRRYIDGGACSTTSADLLAGLGLDEVYVLAPMASFALDQPTAMAARLERRWRRAVTRRLVHEVRKVHTAGSDVTLIAPGPQDLEAMGANVMDPERRLRVLETSLRTSVVGLRNPRTRPHPDDLASAG